ncbi:MAG: carbohydrate-binding domain-containing protein [Clostridia bacterium]|nr:carbohydrate-binding domain-containing protein [Clostridia bacterium]
MKKPIFLRLFAAGMLFGGILLLSACRPTEPQAGTEPGKNAGADTGRFEDVKTEDTPGFADLEKMQTEGVLEFVFSDAAVTCSASEDGYEITGTELKIKKSGTYRLSGACSDGSVTVGKEITDVFLILDGLHLTSSSGPALTCNKLSSVCIFLQEGSENSLSDPFSDHEEGAALKCKAGSSLVLAGEGSLTVNGNSKNGIKGGAGTMVSVLSGDLTVTAKNNALACDSYIEIRGGRLHLTAENDGIKSSPDEDDAISAGNFFLYGGTVTVQAKGDGISADGLLSIGGGTLSVTTTGEVSASPDNSFSFGGMGFPGGWGGGQTVDDGANDVSSKGIKSGTAMKITGGTISVSSTDHALHCSGETAIEGGTLTLASSKAKGIVNHGNLTVSGDSTEIIIDNATEGIESRNSFTLNGGTVKIRNATDDGINIGGSVASSEAENHTFTVNGGSLYLSAQGDGIDSNGNFSLNGGTVVVFGPSNGGNSCLDVQFLSSYKGGTLLGAAASSSMWNEVLGHFTGEYLYTLSGGSFSGQTVVEVCDRDGTVLISELCPLKGNVGIYFMTDKTEDLSFCFFKVDGTVVEPQTGNLTGGMGWNPGGGDHGGGPGGMRPGGR